MFSPRFFEVVLRFGKLLPYRRYRTSAKHLSRSITISCIRLHISVIIRMESGRSSYCYIVIGSYTGYTDGNITLAFVRCHFLFILWLQSRERYWSVHWWCVWVPAARRSRWSYLWLHYGNPVLETEVWWPLLLRTWRTSWIFYALWVVHFIPRIVGPSTQQQLAGWLITFRKTAIPNSWH